MPSIKIVNAALDEVKDEIILRGVIAPESLEHLRIAPYQREALPLTSLRSILGALESSTRLPDIELSMRGQRFKEEEEGNFILRDDVFIVDGLQRVTGAKHFLSQHPEGNPHIGCCIYFGKDELWEADRFRILNTLRSKVAPSVLLRNLAPTNKSAEQLLSLSENDPKFVLRGKVTWTQNQLRGRGELISGLTLAKVAGHLLSHKVGARYTDVRRLIPALDRVIEVVGVLNFRENMRTYFELIHDCWGVTNIVYNEFAVQLKSNFLIVLATVLSDHKDFWTQDTEERKLFVPADLRKKIAQFPINDPQVVRLSGSGGMSKDLLYNLLVNHINSGKRTRRLRHRNGEQIMTPVSNGVYIEEEANA